jgi:hypothetical protein
MNYLFFYSGNIPTYVHKVINSILSIDKESNIIFCSDQNINTKEIVHVNIKDFEFLTEKMMLIKDMYRDTISDYKINPLWATSLLRLYSIEIVAKELNLKEFVHFDTDVLIYIPFSKISDKKVFKAKNLNITFESQNMPIYGYSYVDDLEVLNKINIEVDNFIGKFISHKPHVNDNPINEMKLLGRINTTRSDLINKLPSLPYEEENILFDPVSYGMYLRGADFNQKSYFFKKSFIDLRHDVGAEVKSKRIEIKFKGNTPEVIYNNSRIPLANLHVHSKQFDQLLPSGYKKYLTESVFDKN